MNVFFLPLLIATLNNPSSPESQESAVASSRNSGMIKCQPWLFQFTTFREGLVVFRNNSTHKALLNYNFLHGKLQFIDEHTDTLLLTNKYRIRRVIIAEQEFIPGIYDEDDDMEVVKVYSTLKVVRLTKLIVKSSSSLDQQFKADTSSPIPSSLFISSKMGEFQWQNTTLPNAMRLKTRYYFVDNKGLIYAASLKSIRRLYQKQSAAVRAYSNTHKVDYANVDQVENFLNYLEVHN